MTITSKHNPRLRWVRALQRSSRKRRQEGLWVVEGVRLAEEALRAGWEARLVLYREDLNERGQAVVRAFAARGVPVESVSPSLFDTLSETETPQGLLLVLAQQTLPVPPRADFILIADEVRDPGNLGSILRSAAAAGVQAVFCPPQTVDAFAPKVLRGAMGAHFRMPILQRSWSQIAASLGEVHLFLAAAGEGQPCYQADFRQPLALIVGGEAQGAGQEARRLAHEVVHIPMPGGSESLNVAAAAAVLLFEVVRQRMGWT